MNKDKIFDENYTEMLRYKERLEIALRAAKICIFEVDVVKQKYTFFENSEAIFGISGEDILNDVHKLSELSPSQYEKAVCRYFSHPDDETVINKAFESILNGKPVTYEARMKAGKSDFIWCKIDATPILKNGIPEKMIGVITNISDIKNQKDFLLREIQIDNFTGLYNKKHVVLAIERTLSKFSTQRHALLLIDLDDFKGVNDNYGHAMGDEVIKAFAARLKRSFRKSDIVGRFGGDEFIVMVQDIPSEDWLKEKLSQIIEGDYAGISCTASAGIVFFPQDSSAFSGLFEKADAALYYSKKTKSAYTFFSKITKQLTFALK